MKSYQIREYGEPLQLVEGPEPQPTGTELLIRVLACGVCHSDLHLWEVHFDLGGGSKLDVRGDRTLPFTLGHEIVERSSQPAPVRATPPSASTASYSRGSAAHPATSAAGTPNICACGPGRSGPFWTGASAITCSRPARSMARSPRWTISRLAMSSAEWCSPRDRQRRRRGLKIDDHHTIRPTPATSRGSPRDGT